MPVPPLPVVCEFLGLQAVFSSPCMLAILDCARQFAGSGAAVLIEGESGVGKEVVARAIHHYSARARKPWVDTSLTALPGNLVESELFGHERGAFSGAAGRKPGLFELADGGTLFLDEIGDLDAWVQVKLLRALDDGEYYRLGGTRPIRMDVRIVAATNQDLERAVRQGSFRAALYRRLAQFRIAVPPLRERVADVLALVEFFRQAYAPALPLAPSALDALARYGWPGNVRELRNAMLSAAAVAQGDRIELSDLPAAVAPAASGLAAGTSAPRPMACCGENGGAGDRPGTRTPGISWRNLCRAVEECFGPGTESRP